MMTRKKRRTLIISILVVILLIITTSLIILYLNTDMFKSNQTLFFKYFGNNTQNIKEIEKIFENTEYENSLENNKYLEETEIKINYTQNYGTTSEDTSNNINNLKLTINGQVDKANQYNYKDVKLWKEDAQILNVEYTQDNSTYGIRFSDLFKQYVLVENNNLKELFEKIGYSEEEIEILPDSIELNQDDIFSGIKFNDDEIENLKEKYLNIINQNLPKENFEKKSNQIISINGEDFTVNAYVLKLTNEQLNNMYINILENLKNEEIVLNKIENIQNYVNKINKTSDAINLKDDFVQEIEDIIEEINRNNIGIEETKIIVYENQGNTVRTTIQGIDYQIDLDYIQIDQEKFVQLTLEKNDNEMQKITLKNNNEKINFNIESTDNDVQNTISFEESKKIEDKKSTKNINVKYEDGINRLQANIITNTSIVESFENPVAFNDKNSIKLNDLDEEKLKTVLNKLNELLEQKLNSVTQKIKIEDLKKILTDIGIIKDIQILEGEGISETEKNRFNSKFEILQGEQVDNENMLKILEVIKENLINIQVVSNEQLKVEISKDEKNEEISQTLEAFIKKDKNRKYDVSVEYDEETGLVKYIVLTISE